MPEDLGPICAAAEMVHDNRAPPCTYRARRPSSQGVFCPACGESALDASDSARVSAAMWVVNR